MGIYWRPTKRAGGCWYVDFRLDGRRVVKRVGPSRQVAERAEAVLRARLLDERYARELGFRVRPTHSPTLEQWVDSDYLPGMRPILAPGTYKVRAALCRVLCRVLGAHRLPAIDAAACERYRDARLAQGIQPSSLGRELWVLRHALALARARGQPVPVLAPIRLPRGRPIPNRVLPEDAEARLLAAFRSPKHRAICRLALLTSLRRGEVAGLRVRNVHSEGPFVELTQKGGTLKRVPLVPEAMEVIAAVWPRKATSETPLFPGRGCEPIRGNAVWAAFKRAARRARIPELRFHDLRHTVATRLLRAGADLGTVGAILGHRPPYRETMRYAGHTSEERMRDALGKITTGQAKHEMPKQR